ncbi:hypothetical protein [Kibdelosporangium aridum]|uniref:hypothetical protein n=1 Tax=Kibdelosporangium aridum TaxID=2030 RepID=UPI000525C329
MLLRLAYLGLTNTFALLRSTHSANTSSSTTTTGHTRASPTPDPFQERAKPGGTADVSRVDAIASDALAALHEVVRKHQLTYAEYDGGGEHAHRRHAVDRAFGRAAAVTNR